MIRRSALFRRARRLPSKGSAAIVVLAFALTACSALPDFANPIAIYNNTLGAGKSDNADTYPRLGTVPGRPQTASAAERRKIAQGLVADRDNARYTDDLVRRGDEARPAPAFVAAERRASQPPRRAEVQVAAVQSVAPEPVVQERPRRFTRPRDPAAPVPIEPRRRRQSAAAAAPAEEEPAPARATRERAAAAARRAAEEDDELRRRRLVPAPLAAGNDTIDSRRRITSGSPNSAAARRSTAPRFTVPVPRSIVQRDDEDGEVRRRRVERPQTASVTQPRTREFAAAAPAPETLRRPPPRAESPQSIVVAQAAPRRPPQRQNVRSRPPPIAVVPGKDEFSQVYARMLAASASTITTAPANPAFEPTTALPLPQETLGVSPVVRESYNAALERANAPPEQPARPPATRIVPAPERRNQVAAVTTPSQRSLALPQARRTLAPRPFFASRDPTVTIKFPNGSARITGRYLGVLRDIANRARGNSGLIRVVGHASSRTRDLPLAQHNLVNFSISVDRADAIANALMRLGVSRTRIIVEARGDSDPIFFETMPEGEAENRRVEIFLDF